MVVGIDPVLRSLGPRSEVRNHVPRNDDQHDEAYEEEENPAESEWHRVLLPTNLALALRDVMSCGFPGTQYSKRFPDAHAQLAEGVEPRRS